MIVNSEFVACAEMYIEQLQQQGKMESAKNQTSALRRFLTFLGEKEIPFKDFDEVLVRNYHTWLERQQIGANTISVYMRNLKHLYQKIVAAREPSTQNAFENITTIYRAKQDHNALSLNELKILYHLDLSKERPIVGMARDFFLFAVLGQGMTGGDILYLTSDNIHHDRLTYTVQATGKEVTVPLLHEMRKIIARNHSPESPYFFPLITATDPEERWKQHGLLLQKINRQLHKLGDLLGLSFSLNLTVAKYSWDEALLDSWLSKL